MDLILWRHAEAAEAQVGVDDLQRALTPKGERQARRIAKWLDGLLPSATRILVSPAVRAQQTAQALGQPFKTVAALAPGAGVDDLLAAAGWPDASRPALVVGHQPVLGHTAARLLAGAEQDWSIRKGGVWWFRCRDGGAQITLWAVRSPDAV